MRPRGQRQGRGRPLLQRAQQAPLQHAPKAISAIDPYPVVALATRRSTRSAAASGTRFVSSTTATPPRRFKDARWSPAQSAREPHRQAGDDAQAPEASRRRGLAREHAQGGAPPDHRSGVTVKDVAIPIDRFTSKARTAAYGPSSGSDQTIRRHRDEILHAVELGINQGRTEAPNNKVKLSPPRLRIPQRQSRARSRDAELRTDPSPAPTRATPVTPSHLYRFPGAGSNPAAPTHHP